MQNCFWTNNVICWPAHHRHPLAAEDFGPLAAEDFGPLAAEDFGPLAAEDFGPLAAEDFGPLAAEDFGPLAAEDFSQLRQGLALRRADGQHLLRQTFTEAHQLRL